MLSGFQKITVFGLVFAFFSPNICFGQAVGQYAPRTAPVEDKQEAFIPRVFSSKLTAGKQAEALDFLYYDLSKALGRFSQIDMSHKEKLIELIEPYKFQLTRRASEFKSDLDAAMKSLNSNYKSMDALIVRANEDFSKLITAFPEDQQKIAKGLWDENVKKFKEQSDVYFKQQHNFLNTYNKLVRFILDQSGGYFYDSATKRVAFYRAGVYQTFGRSVDELNKINHQQKILIRELLPAF